MKKIWIIILAVTCTGIRSTVELPWSTVHKRIYSDRERFNHSLQESVLFSKEKILPFSQLVLCWNGETPKTGSLEFFMRAQVKVGSKSLWEPWYKVASWSAHKQRSFHGKGWHSEHNYVRLELKNHAVGTGFEVKVVGKNGACQNLYALFVCASDLKRFKEQDSKTAAQGLETVRVHGVRPKSQRLIDHPRGDALCSPTSLSMILEYLLQEPVDELQTAHGVYDAGLDVYGSWPFNMAYAFERCHKEYFWYVKRLDSFAKLHSYLVKGFPVEVSIRGPLKGGKAAYRSGHLLVVVGYDAKHKKVVCFDPAALSLDEIVVPYDLSEFLTAWDKTFRLAYIASKRL